MRTRTRTLCIRRTLCKHVTVGTPIVIFAVLTVFWLSFDCFWRLVHCWYTVGTVLVDMWRLVHQWLFLLYWLSCDWFWLFLTNQQCTNRQKQSKTIKYSIKMNIKITISVPIVTCLHRVRRIHKVRVRSPRSRPPNTQSPYRSSIDA